MGRGVLSRPARSGRVFFFGGWRFWGSAVFCARYQAAMALGRLLPVLGGKRERASARQSAPRCDRGGRWQSARWWWATGRGVWSAAYCARGEHLFAEHLFAERAFACDLTK